MSPVLFPKLEDDTKQGGIVIDNNRINFLKDFNKGKNYKMTFNGDKGKVLHLDAKSASLLQENWSE